MITIRYRSWIFYIDCSLRRESSNRFVDNRDVIATNGRRTISFGIIDVNEHWPANGDPVLSLSLSLSLSSGRRSRLSNREIAAAFLALSRYSDRQLIGLASHVIRKSMSLRTCDSDATWNIGKFRHRRKNRRPMKMSLYARERI
jgi:hypothetical protein